VGNLSKPLQTLGSSLGGDSSASQDFARFSQNLTTRSLPNFSGEYLTVREAAALLKVSSATIYRLCHSGALAHVRVSNAIRILR
jgi:excisionase family DNA binding protein